jgi:hypothetical protein
MTTHTDDSLGSIPAGEAGEPVGWRYRIIGPGMSWRFTEYPGIAKSIRECMSDEDPTKPFYEIEPLYTRPSTAPAAAVRIPGIDGRAEKFCAWLDDFRATHGGLRPDIGDAFDAAYRMAWADAAAPAGGGTTLSDEEIARRVLGHDADAVSLTTAVRIVQETRMDLLSAGARHA